MELLPASLAQGLTDGDVEAPEELMEMDGQGGGYVEEYHLEDLFGECWNFFVGANARK